MQDGDEEFAAGSGGEAGLQPGAEGHQGIDLGRDAVLFGEGLEGDILPSRCFIVRLSFKCVGTS